MFRGWGAAGLAAVICLAAAAARAADPSDDARAAAAVELSSPTVVSITVRGNEAIDPDELLKALPLKAGDAFSPGRVELARRMAVSFCQTRGYAEAQAEADWRVDGGSAAVSLAVREGPFYRFGPTRVTGLEKLSARAVRRELAYREGDPFDRRKLFESQGKLYSLGFFDDIDIRSSTTPARVAEVEVRLKERPLRWIRGGAGYGSEERQRLSLIWTDNNFLRRAYKLELSSTYSAIWLEHRAEFVNRYLFGTRTEQRTAADWRREDRESYEWERTQGEVSLGRRLPFHVQASPRYRLQRAITFQRRPEVAATTPPRSLTSAADLSFSRDMTDDPFFPERGTRAGLVLERSGGFLGGDIHFNKAFVNVAAYRRVAGPVIAAAAGRAGAARPFRPSMEVPIFERFFTGGANSVRGYRERGVGPRDAAGDPLGGRRLLGANLELRFPVVWRIYGAVFLDGGQTADTAGGVRLDRWRSGTGAGIRFRTPVGPLRLDYGHKLQRDPSDPSLWRLHFSLGEAF